MNAYLPIKNRICPGVYIVSAIYKFDCNIENFDIPFTLHLQHCVNLQSSEDCQKMCVVSQHGDGTNIKDGNFISGSHYSTLRLNKFCTKYIIWSEERNNQAINIHIVEFPIHNEPNCFHNGQQFSSSALSYNLEKEQEQSESPPLCYEWMLALPKNHLKLSNWKGTFCVYVKLAAMRKVRKCAQLDV